LSGTESPSVSIVLATRNRRDWLRLAIDSVLEQDYPDLELLVMDDGSTDATPELLEHYARRHPPERFRFSRHENMGQARTLNRGYELARGEVLGYLSDDDLLGPGAVSRLVLELADPEVVCVYPGYRIIDADGEVIDTFRPIEYSPTEAFRLMDTVIGPGGLVRRTVLAATGGWDPDLHFMGDFILWMKVGLAGRVVRVPEPLAFWRRHTGGISIQVAAEHGRELIRLVDLADSVLGLPPDALPVRAEALRNACIQATVFGGGSGASPGKRFATIDLTRPATSALSAGLGPTELVDDRADEASKLWREIARLTAELTHARGVRSGASEPRPKAPGAGLEAARQRLRSASVAVDHRIELMEAAVECGADTDPASSRYLVLDRSTGTIPDDEFDQLNLLGYGTSPEQLRSLIADRRRKLEAL
jgi:Glycosyl transferase family 2